MTYGTTGLEPPALTCSVFHRRRVPPFSILLGSVQLQEVVPWGRSLDEYRGIFRLDLLPLIYRTIITRAVRFMPHRDWLRSASKLTTGVLLGILVPIAEIGCTHYNTVERWPGSGLSEIVSPDGQVLCTGRWSSNGPEGPWDFYESNGNRTATILFSQGAPAGQLRFYWGSQSVPSAAGKLQVVGTVRDGAFEHRWIRYAANGAVMNETVYWNDEIMNTRSFSSEGAELPPVAAMEKARLLDNADRRLLRSLLKIVHHAKPQSH